MRKAFARSEKRTQSDADGDLRRMWIRRADQKPVFPEVAGSMPKAPRPICSPITQKNLVGEVAISVLLLGLNSVSFAAPSIAVTAIADDALLRVNATTTVRVYAQVNSPASPSDGLFEYDLNAATFPAGVLSFLSTNFAQPGAESPSSPGALSTSVISQVYGTYFTQTNVGIAAPQELFHFTVKGTATGPATISITPDNTIGADFYLQQSTTFTTNYTGASTTITVRPGDEWKNPTGGTYTTAANWVNGAPPNAVDAIADFLTNLAVNSNVTLASPITLGEIRFNNANRYTLTGGSISLQTSSGQAGISVQQGTQTIASPLSLASATTINLIAGNLTFTGGLSAGASIGFTKNGIGALTISGSQNYGAGASFTAAAGTTTFASDAGPSTASLVILLNGGNVNFSSSQHLANLTLTTGTATVLAGTTKTNGLTLSGSTNNWTSTLALNTNKLIVEATAPTKAAVFTTLQNQTAYGAKHSSGITTSTLPTNMSVAVIDNAALSPSLSTFGGISVDSNSLLVSPELLGDANIDGHIDLTDLSTILNNFGAATSAWTSGNFDGALTIDLTDLSDVLNNFGLSNPNANVAQPLFAVPEPASLDSLVLGVAALAGRRQRCHRSP